MRCGRDTFARASATPDTTAPRTLAHRSLSFPYRLHPEFPTWPRQLPPGTMALYFPRALARSMAQAVRIRHNPARISLITLIYFQHARSYPVPRLIPCLAALILRRMRDRLSTSNILRLFARYCLLFKHLIRLIFVRGRQSGDSQGIQGYQAK
jgi:hypothetical protein